MANLIEESDVSIVNLSLQLENSVIRHALLDDESIYVTEDGYFPFWIKVCQNKGFVVFVTYTYFRKKADLLQRLEIVNDFNKSSFMVTAYADDDTCKFDHELIFRDGLLTETFVRGCRHFSRNVERAIHRFDPGHQIIRPLGETESDDLQEK